MEQKLYEAIAASLRDFGYPSTTAQMIRETHEAMARGVGKNDFSKLPHGVVSAFAADQIETCIEKGALSRTAGLSDAALAAQKE